MSPVPRRSGSSLLARGFLACLLAGAALAFGLGWHVSGRIEREALLASFDRVPARLDDVRVAALDARSVTLTPLRDERGRAGREGAWLLAGPNGTGRVGRVIGRARSLDGDPVREFQPLEGHVALGDSADLRTDVVPGDPLRGRGIAFDEVEIPTELGPAPAWRTPGSRDAWFLFVHGKGADRRQALRILPLVHELGFPALVLTYRNDPEAPASPDGRYHYGLTEWKDVEAAASYALSGGARDLYVMGTSMGGGIVATFLGRSALAGRVRGAILDAPMLDFGATIDEGVRHATIPGTRFQLPALAGDLGKRFACWRFGVDWDSLDLHAEAVAAGTPILLLHGDHDETVPVTASRALALAHPDQVTLVEFPGAGHAEGWNVDSVRYVAAVRAFLERPR